jgi:transcription initiation factor TFIID subunit 13
VSFEATRAAHHAGRQKVKFEDFEFAMRRNPRFMGKIQEVFEKKKEIEAARKNFNIDDQLMKDADREEKQAEKQADKSSQAGKGGTKRTARQVEEEELDEGDDDLDVDGEIGPAPKKR